MTRKDYILIAKALRKGRQVITEILQTRSGEEVFTAAANFAGFTDATERVASALATDNPRFDREHFLAVVRGEKELTSRPSRKVRGHESFCLNRGVQNDGTCSTCGESNGQHNYACTDSRVVGS